MAESEAYSPEEIASFHFVNMVMQIGNAAMTFLGRIPHPETQKNERNLEAAQMFIGQLEMLELKTKGNLNKEEQDALGRMLTSVRLAFVEEVSKPAQASGAPESSAPVTGSTPAQQPETPPASVPESAAADDKKKFVKKY